MRDFGVYIVMTDPVLGYSRFTELCVAEGVPMLQLRDKHMSDRELFALILRLREITKGSDTRLLINDRFDLASLGELDGLHLGPDDLPWQKVARLLAPDILLGVSTHSPEEAQNLIAEYNKGLFKPDYMSFGPIYPTPAKAKADAAQGLARLAAVLQTAPIPLVAIGGIFPHNLPEILACGARNVAMIRHFTLSVEESELRDKIRTCKATIEETNK